MLRLMRTIRSLVWYEMALAVSCTCLSFAGFIGGARALIFVSFLFVTNIKLYAVGVMTRGPDSTKLPHASVLKGFLGGNYECAVCSFRCGIPVRKYVALSIIYFPNFAETALTGVALPELLKTQFGLALLLGLTLAASIIVQLVGSLRCLNLSKLYLIAAVGNVMCGFIPTSYNFFWHCLARHTISLICIYIYIYIYMAHLK